MHGVSCLPAPGQADVTSQSAGCCRTWLLEAVSCSPGVCSPQLVPHPCTGPGRSWQRGGYDAAGELGGWQGQAL